MRKLATLTFQTLDGVMQAPSSPDEDMSDGFAHGGWANQCWQEVMEQVSREAMAEPYDLLLGGATYRIFAPHFSQADVNDPTTHKLNQAKKYVVTSSQDELAWQNSHRITGDVIEAITALKQQDGPLLQVHGSWQLIQTLLHHNLIDEFRLWTFPVIVGAGKRLFADGAIPKDLTLTKLEACPSGAFMHIYQSSTL